MRDVGKLLSSGAYNLKKAKKESKKVKQETLKGF